ncbi:hypothetical protein LJ725_15095 [Reyranella aquatilis]|uniref:Uncharacterized protein n=1 Tax=Reyranella aquatilis TaxID=2035356 RepID=A0ABS8KW42_9HYPH|nr:hypothetical protein [Reyranella aquatilis]MCC8430300.1 hypothetical protein [Reyranella aquatilis]
MFKTILATATAALIATAIGAPAQAASCLKCLPNGVEMNGLGWNGLGWNGLGWNGLGWNGIAPAASSFVLEAIELPPQEH